MKILIVEDEIKTGEYLSKGLTEAGFVVDRADNGLTGYHLAMTADYDLLILDIMLPDVNGWDIIRMLRSAGKGMPVLLLSALGTIEHRVKGLELGADDYLVKPFAFAELLARVRTLLRRGNTVIAESQFTVADLSIDLVSRKVNRAGNRILLTSKEFSLLIILLIRIAVRQGHLPLRNVSNAIKNITSENLDARLEPSRVPVELEQLVISFNHMIEKIEDVFTRQANFSADIAHEIRTPITNLVTQTEIALSQNRSPKELEDVLYSSLEEYNRMTRMVSDMLFLAQADNNQLIPDRVTFDLSAEVMKVFDFFEAWAEERHITLRFNGTPCLIDGDPQMFRRAINNLLSNALRYTPDGETVTVSVSEKENVCELIVANPGKPIPEAHLPRLFDRFYRVDPSRQRKGEGNGIGLAIVKSIITAHHGNVRVESDAVSTRFILSVPRLMAHR